MTPTPLIHRAKIQTQKNMVSYAFLASKRCVAIIEFFVKFFYRVSNLLIIDFSDHVQEQTLPTRYRTQFGRKTTVCPILSDRNLSER